MNFNAHTFPDEHRAFMAEMNTKLCALSRATGVTAKATGFDPRFEGDDLVVSVQTNCGEFEVRLTGLVPMLRMRVQ